MILLLITYLNEFIFNAFILVKFIFYYYSHLSNIFIKNHNLIDEIKLDKQYNFSFKTIYEKLLRNLKKIDL